MLLFFVYFVCLFIPDIKDAKSEIFRTLSMLSVSKTRFKSLLKWMKTLKLEEGKKGLQIFQNEKT